MRVLHIGDYHFKPKGNNYEQKLMVDSLIEHLKTKTRLDLVLFSGDLVNSGSTYENFRLAHNSLIQPISDHLKIPLKNIIIATGNHDTRREDALKSVTNYFDEKIKTNELLSSELAQRTEDYKLSIKPSNNFVKYLNEFFDTDYDTIDHLFSIHRQIIDGKNIGIVTLNSAWLSSGHRDDLNKLMLPTEVLKNALVQIKSSDCKILMIHHPLNYFKEFNGMELEDLIHKEFHFIFSGHIHREQMSTKYAGNNGIYANTTQATLTFDRDGEIGYSIINYDLEGCGEIIVERGTFSKKENRFIDLTPVHIQVPFGEEKAQQNKLRNKITSKIVQELDAANGLLLEYDEEKKESFLDFFTPPILSTNSGTDNTTTEKHGLFNFENLYNDDNNYLIFGRDKSGKTSILKKLQLHFLKNYSVLSKVPFYLDYKELESKQGSTDIKRIIRNYYEIPHADADKLIETGRMILLIDNLNTNSEVNEIVIKFLADHSNIQFIICSENLTTRVYFEELDHLIYTKLYFKDLTRKEIRLYSQKNNSVKEHNKEEVLEKISKMLLQLQLPVNYWTISLILLIYKKSNDDYNKNLFGILDLCVDEILQKRKIAFSKAKLSFEQYKEICSRIAHFLLVKFKDDVYSASATDLISFINELMKENQRLGSDAKDIFDYLLDVGLLKEKNSKYTFRLNGLFEYFLAYHIKQFPNFKEEILSNDNIYLSFKNELEIYSGLNRNDHDFLKKVFEKTRLVFDPIIKNYKDVGSPDTVLMNKLGEVQELAERIKKLSVSSPLSHELQDSVRDSMEQLNTNSEVHLKDYIDSNNITPEVLEKYLGIFSRIFKNSDNIANAELEYEIFDYIIEAYISFGFYLIDEFSKFSKGNFDNGIEYDEDGNINIGKDLIKILSNFIPIITQVLLYDGVGHPNLVTIIHKHIEKYKIDAKKNQYKLFLLYFLLIDLDVKSNKHYLDEVFDLITLSPLKVSTYFKLNFYLAFKAYKNKELEVFFKVKVKEAQIRMDSKIEKDKIDKNLSNKQKANLVRNQKNV